MSTTRLLNALRFKDLHHFPREYLDACMDELIQRGFSREDIYREIEREQHPEKQIPPTRFTLLEQLRRLRFFRLVALAIMVLSAFFSWQAHWTNPLATSLFGVLSFGAFLWFLRLQYKLQKLSKIANQPTISGGTFENRSFV